jgi:CubicO group peptidase (beta-lactamase class C family)
MFLLFLLMVSAGVAQDKARMDAVASSHTEGDRFMGNVLVARDGVVVFEKGYGWANMELKVPHTAAGRFRIGSVTKQFTAAAILLLEEQGKLRVDDPVARHIPEAPVAWKEVTLFHLLTHTSGIRSFTDLPSYATWKLSPEGPAQTFGHIRDLPLEFAPGERHKYSNSGYVLLGWIVERVSGRSYGEFLRENIFDPLGMKDSGYDTDTALLPPRAAGYVPGPGGPVKAPFIDMHVPHGAGALYSTTGDLLRWTQGLFGGKLLSAASLEKMTTPFKNNYAFGLGVSRPGSRKSYSHGGGIEGFNAHLAYFPEGKVTVVVLANVNGPAFTQLGAQLAALAFDEKVVLPSERREIEVPAASLERFVGVYRLNPTTTITIRLTDSRLTAQLSGQAAYPLYPEAEGKFFLKIVDAQVEFITDEQGRVPSMLLHQNGGTRKAVRISDAVVERTAITVPLTTLAIYTGSYELQPGFDLAITLEDGRLMSQATGQGKAELFAEAETKFFLKIVDAQIEFFKDAQGAVTHLVLHQGGRDIRGTRKL